MQRHKQSFQFAELNIRHRGDPERTLAIVRRAVRMGYDAVAINVDIGKFGAPIEEKEPDIEEEDAAPKKKKRKKQKQQQKGEEEAEIVPDPFLVDESKLDLSMFATAGSRFRQFSRLTVTLEADSLHRLQHHKKVRLYDLLAVRVPDEQILLTLQRKGDFIDLVSVDATAVAQGRVPWMFKQKIVQSCIAAGLTFELCYAHALVSSEHRRQFFANARRLMAITRAGRAGVVLSSGADGILQLRGPFDVANLCALFGLQPKCGRRFVASNARACLLRAQTRRHTVKGAVHMVDLAATAATSDQRVDDPQVPSTSRSAFVSDASLHQLASIVEFAAEMPATKIGNKSEAKSNKNGEEKSEPGEKSHKKKPQKRPRMEGTNDEDIEEEIVCSDQEESNEVETLFEIFT